MWTAPAAAAALLLAALACGTGRADDAPKSPPASPPDPGFLEFLGSVDGLAEVNPDYLTQGDTARPGASPPNPAVNPPPPAASVPGAKHDE